MMNEWPVEKMHFSHPLGELCVPSVIRFVWMTLVTLRVVSFASKNVIDVAVPPCTLH